MPAEPGPVASDPMLPVGAHRSRLLAAISTSPAATLTLEAGLCLYGHDIDATTTPVEAGLAWAVSKARRPNGARAGSYPGGDVIATQLAQGVRRKRVGLLPRERVPVREGAELVAADGRAVGKVTSGGFGPTRGAPVAMGYVVSESAAIGTMLASVLS